MTEGTHQRGLGRQRPSRRYSPPRTGSWARSGHHQATPGDRLEPAATAKTYQVKEGAWFGCQVGCGM